MAGEPNGLPEPPSARSAPSSGRQLLSAARATGTCRAKAEQDDRLLRAAAHAVAAARACDATTPAGVLELQSRKSARAYLFRQSLRRGRERVMVAYLLLGLLEPPPFCFWDEALCVAGKPGPELYVWALPMLSPTLALLAALLCLLPLAADCCLAVAVHGGRRVLRTAPLEACSTFLVAASLVEVALRLGLPAALAPGFPWLYRILRPLFLSCVSRQARTGIHLVTLAVWETRHLYIFVMSFLLFYAWAALVMFADKDVGPPAFDTYSECFKQLFVLLTTSNYPDVQTPLVNDFRPNFLFFLPFVVIFIFLFTNLILSDIYAAYHKVLQDQLLSAYRYRESALRQAFDLLCSCSFDRGATDGASEPLLRQQEKGCRTVSLTTWRAFLHLWSTHAPLPGDCADSLAERADQIYNQVQRESPTAEGLDQDEFCALLLTLSDKQVYRSSRRAFDRSPFASLRDRKVTLRASLVSFGIRWKEYLEAFVDVLLVIYILMLWQLTAEMVQHLPAVKQMNQGWTYGVAYYLSKSWSEFFLYAFSMLWVLELAIRIIAFGGPRRYWNEGNLLVQRSDAIVVLSIAALDSWAFLPFLAVPPNFYKLLLMLRLVRASRIFLRRPRFQAFVWSLVRVVPALSTVLSCIMVVHLFYAEVGVQLFGGVLRRDNRKLEGSSWMEQSYWSNNFNCSASAIMVLFQQLVVNNWFIVMDACGQALGDWVRVYFMSHYVAGVTVLMNVFTAFIIEAWHQQLSHFGDRRPCRSRATSSQAAVARSLSPALAGLMERAISEGDVSLNEEEQSLSREAVLREMFENELKTVFEEPASRRLRLARRSSRSYVDEVPGLAAVLGAPLKG